MWGRTVSSCGLRTDVFIEKNVGVVFLALACEEDLKARTFIFHFTSHKDCASMVKKIF